MRSRHGWHLASMALIAALAVIGVAVSRGDAALAAAGSAVGPAPAARVIAADQALTMEVRQGRLIRLPRPAAAVFVADPQVADVQAHSPTLIYLFGRRSGETTLFAVDENEEVLFQRSVTVEHHLSGLERVLGEVAPGDAVSVRSVDGGIILDGSVADPRRAQEIKDIAGRYLGENETLINRLDVAAPTQVNLRVKVAEVSRDVTKLFGINWEAALSTGNFVFGLATGRAFTSNGAPPFSRYADSTGLADNVAARYSTSKASINSVIDALERDGLVNVLAEPNLTALSGETASFLAGGEFPVPVGQNDSGNGTSQIEIQFKQFGVSLAFTPTVLGPDRISLKVRPEVSDLSDKGAIRLNSITIPALSTRRAETTVELASGQSFAIGGLVSNSIQNSFEKFPGLGDLPVLGPLFRSTNFQRSETELVIVVTPYLVRPVSAAGLAGVAEAQRDASALQPAPDAPTPGDVLGDDATLRPGVPGPAATLLGRLAGPAGFILN